MTSSNLLLITYPAPSVALITLNRPDAANALNTLLASALAQILPTLTARVIILTGAGQKAFCAGADLKERNGMDERQWKAQHKALHSARDAVLNCPIPIIAAVNGAAYGGGLELALSCDFIYASKNATFALPEASLGIMPGMGGTQTLTRRIGAARAKQMLYTASPCTATQALEWGLANRIMAADLLLPETLACAQRMAQNAPLSLNAIKRAVSEGEALPLQDALKTEMHHYTSLLSTTDRHEGINAFNEKRKAVFLGE